MNTIAFAWELGSNFGHIGELLTVAKLMPSRGHRAILLMRELHNLSAADIAGLSVFQAPVWLPQVNGLPEPPLSYAEILLRFGYHDATFLQGLILGWRSLLQLGDTKILVANHSPTALIAALTLDMPAVTLGSGFYVPPRLNPVPCMRTWAETDPQRLADSDRMVTESINQVLASYGKPALGCVAELFDVASNIFCTFPELDHYQSRETKAQRGHYVGTMFEADRGEAEVWPDGMGPKVLLYLRPEVRDVELLIQALNQLDCRVLAVVPGISANLRAKLEAPNCRIVNNRLHLASVTTDCDFAVSYAGHGFVSAMLLAGIPLLLVPTHLEQFLVALRVLELGAGIVVDPEAPPPDYQALLTEMQVNLVYKEAARNFAAKYADFDQDAQQETILQLIEQVAQ